MTSHLDSAYDYEQFQKEDFDPAEYARSISHPSMLSSSQQQPVQDIFHIVAKLTFAIDHLNTILHDNISSNYEQLLLYLQKLMELEMTHKPVSTYVEAVNLSVARLKSSIKDPYEKMNHSLKMLANIHVTTELLRNMTDALSAGKKVGLEISSGVSPLVTSNYIKEFHSTVLEPVKKLDVVQMEINRIALIEKQVREHALRCLNEGMSDKKQFQLTEAIQILNNLGTLEIDIQETLNKIISTVTDEVKAAFEVTWMEKEVRSQQAQTRALRRVESVPLHIQFATFFWPRVEKLTKSLLQEFSKVYFLDYILQENSESIWMENREKIIKQLDGTPPPYCWKAVTTTCERSLYDSLKVSRLLVQALQTSPANLIKEFEKLFTSISEVVSNYSFDGTSRKETMTPRPGPEKVLFMNMIAGVIKTVAVD